MSDPSASFQQNAPTSNQFKTESPAPFNLTMPPQHMNGLGSNGNQQMNGSSSRPDGSNHGETSGLNGNTNQNFDQAALQARIALAQQMAQAGMQHQSQHEQQMHQQNQQGQAQERRTSGPMPDWSQLANAGMGGMMNGAQGATREALMKQLQALQSSHAAATRNRLGSATGSGQSPPAPSPGMSNPSPGPNQASLQADVQVSQSPASATHPLRSSSIDATRTGSFSGPPPTGSPFPPQSATSFPPQSASPFPPQSASPFPSQSATPFPPTPAAPTIAGAPYVGGPLSSAPTPTTANPLVGTSGGSPIRPPLSAGPGRPMHNLFEQRRQFLNSLVSYHKQRNLRVPQEIFNGERDGAIKMGETWVEVVELFMSVLRVGGLKVVSKLTAESPFWQGFLRKHSIPNPLPVPVNIPRSHREGVEQVVETTTDPVQFLSRAYILWLSGFEQHMQQSQMAVRQRQQGKQGNVRPPPSGSMGPGSQSAPSPASTSAPTPTMASAPTPGSVSAPSPIVANAPTPSAPTPTAPTSSQGDATAVGPSTLPPAQQAAVPLVENIERPSSTKPVPPPIKVEELPSTPAAPSPVPSNVAPMKRKVSQKRKSGAGTTDFSRDATPAATPGDTIAERPPTPKRKRYKVEYRPLHLPTNNLAGWDERAVGSTFPKNNIGHPARSIHELGTVDMEAIIMGIRSRIPRELGYGLTVLSMLSMGVPEENIQGLSLAPVPELYVELLELLSDSAFGEDGYQAWSESAPKKSNLNDMTFGELEQLGRDMDFGLDERRDSTGGQTDVVLTCLNLLRNFTMLQENWPLMTQSPEVFETLARITDGRLCRLPYDEVESSGSHKPYSLYELARVRRDVVSILANLGSSIDLRQVSSSSVEQVIKVIASFLASGFTMQATSDPLYGLPTSHPPTAIHSVNRAVEAFCKLSWSDTNREILSKLSTEQHVALFDAMIKLLPVQQRQFDWLRSSEEYLGQTECLALSLYSLAFTAPLPTRTIFRHVPGAIQVITRIVHDLARRGQEYRMNPYGVLVRRLAEILGVLNGTSGLALQADPVGMSFSAILGDDGSRKRGTNKVVEKGWLAFDEERITDSMATRGMDVPAFVELDNLWWGVE